MKVYLGFDVGGTKIAISLGTAHGELIGSSRVTSKDRSPNEVLPEIVAAGKKLISDHGYSGLDLQAIGIGAPAPMDIWKGTISPCNMPAWKNVAIRDYLFRSFGVEAFFDNDANAGALAEWFFGSGIGCQDIVYLTLSTGIGGGIIANGKLVIGNSLLAGEMGHVILDIDGPLCSCGNRGCYEAFCGGLAIANHIKKEMHKFPDCPIAQLAGGLDKVDLIALEKGVRENDPYSLGIWQKMCLRHAQAIGGIINTLSPKRIVLGTLANAAGELFMNPVREYLPRFVFPAMRGSYELTTSKLGKQLGEYSGIAVALYGLHKRGEWPLPWR
ncbi:MAG: ROK family protein [Minisyncoccia bacterium]